MFISSISFSQKANVNQDARAELPGTTTTDENVEGMNNILEDTVGLIYNSLVIYLFIYFFFLLNEYNR